jgi:HEAT repeat protein
MKRVVLPFVLLLLAGLASTGRADDPWWYRWFGDPSMPSAQQIKEDEATLKAAKIDTDGANLLKYLRSLVPTPEAEAKAKELFQKLGSENFKEREQATTDILGLGPKVVPVLKQMLPGSVLEVRMRAESCIKKLEDKSPASNTSAVIRLLKARRPEGTVAGLLEFSSYAPDEGVVEDILDATYGVGLHHGKIDPALDKALASKSPAARAIAAVLLGRFGNDGQRKAVADLLDDKSPEVRFRAAQGLLAHGDRAMLPVMLDNLKSAPRPLAERAEEILMQIADKSAPKATLGTDDASRKKCAEAWKEWLDANQAKADVKRAALGFPLPSAEYRTRDVVNQFFEIMVKPNDPMMKEKVARLTDVPFFQAGQMGVGGMTINTREEWENMLDQQKNAQPPEGLKYKLTVKSIQHLNDYLQNAKQAEKDILTKYSPGDVRVAQVRIEIAFQGQEFNISMPMFVRVSGARGRIFGFGETQIDMQK